MWYCSFFFVSIDRHVHGTAPFWLGWAHVCSWCYNVCSSQVLHPEFQLHVNTRGFATALVVPCRLRLPPGLPALPLARWWHRRWHGNTAHLQGGRCARENANSTSNKEGLDQNTDVGLACRHAHEKHEATSSLKRLPRLLLSGARGAPWIAFDGQETNVLLHPIAHKHTVTASRFARRFQQPQ